ncbi:hypothetical protein, partial [Fibrobacter intestinalis]|uniref:hypothetical protein n=1 Tax=Fibrobacter sp. NR9 TaxID=1896200 RepID=UPI000BC3EB8F
ELAHHAVAFHGAVAPFRHFEVVALLLDGHVPVEVGMAIPLIEMFTFVWSYVAKWLIAHPP